MCHCLQFSALIVCLLSLPGCASKTDQPTEQPHESELTADWTTPSMAEAEEFARRLEEQIAVDAILALDEAMDWPVLVDRSLGGLGFDKRELRGIERDWIHKMKGPQGIGPQIGAILEAGGDYELLRVHRKEGQLRALFRMLTFDGMFNYHDYHLGKRPDGQIKATDIDVFLSGEPLSQTVRRIILPMVAQRSNGLLERLTRAEGDSLKHSDKIESLHQALRRKDYPAVLRAYKSLPESLQKDKTYMLFCIQAATQMERFNDEMPEYERVIREYRETFPDDPNTELISFEYYRLSKEYASALASIGRLDESVGRDPFLDVQRAGILIEQGKLAKAQELIDRARKALPDKIAVFHTALGVALMREDFELVLAHLIEGEEQFGFEYNDLTTIPEYEGFIRSPQYEKWLERQLPPD